MHEHTSSVSLRTILDLQPGDHISWLYENEQERWLALVPFLQRGLERDEKVLCIVDPPNLRLPLTCLREAGVVVNPYLASGQFGIVSSSDTYLRHGRFVPDAMIDLAKTETARALAQGYTALRVAAEMTWALQRMPGVNRLVEYESQANAFFAGSRCIGLCQYDRRRFEALTLLPVLLAHPTAMLGTQMYDNAYYMPWSALVASEPSASRGSTWTGPWVRRARQRGAPEFSREHLEMLIRRRTAKLEEVWASLQHESTTGRPSGPLKDRIVRALELKEAIDALLAQRSQCSREEGSRA